MKFQKFSIALVLVLALFAGSTIFAIADSKRKTPPSRLIVGTFDSRAVAVAYAHSKGHNDLLKEKKAEHKKAKAAGDTEKVKELENWGQTQQDKLHQQGFGTASVKGLLEHVKGDIPKVAKQAGVDIIVSKWDMVYQVNNAEFVDVTEMIVRGFELSDKTLKMIREMAKHEPLSDDVIENHKH